MFEIEINENVYKVYDVKSTDNIILFLVYKNGKWLYVDARLAKPYTPKYHY